MMNTQPEKTEELPTFNSGFSPTGPASYQVLLPELRSALENIEKILTTVDPNRAWRLDDRGGIDLGSISQAGWERLKIELASVKLPQNCWVSGFPIERGTQVHVSFRWSEGT